VLAWRERVSHRLPPPRAAVVEVPLLFESGMDRLFDATIAVIADERLRARRAAIRDHSSLDERLARQLPQADKAARATFALVNDSSPAKLQEELTEVLVKLDRERGS
jgi:dephospho-CoA kinase